MESEKEFLEWTRTISFLRAGLQRSWSRGRAFSAPLKKKTPAPDPQAYLQIIIENTSDDHKEYINMYIVYLNNLHRNIWNWRKIATLIINSNKINPLC